MFRKKIFLFIFFLLLYPCITSMAFATAYTSTVMAVGGQTINLDAGDTITITTPAFIHFGLYAVGNNSTINAPGVIITTSLINGMGAISFGTGSTITLTNTSINTSANASHGVLSHANTLLNGTNTVINVTGTGSYGAWAQNGTIRLMGGSITTQGTGGHGLVADNSDITLPSGSVTVSNTTVTASGANSSALAILSGLSNDPPNTITVNNSTLTSTQSSGILANSGIGNINLNSGSTLTGGNGVLLDANTASNINLTANNSVLTGDINIDNSSTVNMILQNSAIWTGAANNLTTLNIDPSTWNITGNSTVTGNVTNDGIINFVPDGANFKTLTVGSYTGQNGIIELNALATTNPFVSDMLIINGGTASGATGLIVRNVGLGGLTSGDGVLVVDTINGGTTTANAFSLAAPALAGPYKYALYQGGLNGTNPNNWYLRNTLFGLPDYREETSLYAALPSIAFLYDRALLETTRHATRVWSRVINRGGNANNFNYHFVALQSGFDFFHTKHTSGSENSAGVSFTMGDGTSNVEHSNGNNAGNNNFNAYTTGVYLTHVGASGWYVDGVLQRSWYDFSANSTNNETLTPNGSSASASLEGGYPFSVINNFKIEPQAQMIYQTLAIENTADSAAPIKFNYTNGFATRVGVRFSNDWFLKTMPKNSQKITAWFKTSVWNQTNGNSTTSVLSGTGYIPFHSALSGNWIEANLGITGELTDIFSVYGTLGRAVYTNGRGKSYDAVAGVRICI